jgi:phosphoribosylanthranilate isomerase
VDARFAGEQGARYGGVIFAGGPRSLSEGEALAVLAAFPAGMKKVGVMGELDARTLSERARRLRLDVVQMHGDPLPSDVAALRSLWGGEIWAVVRSADIANGGQLMQLFSSADAVLVDAGSRGTLGGTGQTFNWQELAPLLAHRKGGKLVLAGGLRPDNVAAAISALGPDVVDVVSGVESAPGVKDHSRMIAFAQAARSALGD